MSSNLISDICYLSNYGQCEKVATKVWQGVHGTLLLCELHEIVALNRAAAMTLDSLIPDKVAIEEDNRLHALGI